MRTSITLLTLFMPFLLLAQQRMKLENGWEYAIMRAGNGKKTTREHAIEAHFTIRDEQGAIIGSTLPLGAPSYQILSEMSDKFQAACEATSEGGRYIFYMPTDDFKRVMGGSTPPGMRVSGEEIAWEIEVIRVLPAKPSVQYIVLETLQSKGADAAYDLFKQLANESEHTVYFGELEVNGLGYAFLAKGKIIQAVDVFEFNVKMYPHSANAYDSLGEGLVKAGNIPQAIEQYKRSLELNPDNENARKVIEQLTRK